MENKRKKPRRFRTTFIYWSLLLALVPMLLLAIPLMIQQYRASYAKSLLQVDQDAKFVAYDLTREIELVVAHLQSIARSNDVSLGVEDFLLRTAVSEEMRRFLTDNPVVVKIGLYSKEGNPLITDPPSVENGMNENSEDAVSRALKGIKEIIVSQPLYTFFLSNSDLSQIVSNYVSSQGIGGMLFVFPVVQSFSSFRHLGYIACVVSGERLVQNLRTKGNEKVFIKVLDDNETANQIDSGKFISTRVPWQGRWSENTPTRERLFIELSGERAPYFRDAQLVFFQILAGVMIAAALAGFVAMIIGRKLLQPLQEILWLMRRYANGDFDAHTEPLHYKEFNEVKETLETMAKEIEKNVGVAAEKARVEAELNFTKAVADLAEQVAHDVRSPLAALSQLVSLEKFGVGLSDTERSIFKQAINRIRDISRDLSTKQTTRTKVSDSPTTPRRRISDEFAGQDCDVIALLQQIISEIRLKHQSKSHLKIGFVSFPYASMYVKAPRGDLARVFSNIINNSIEALEGEGRIFIEVEKGDSKTASISVSDNGRGMTQATLRKIGSKGVTFGKPGGSGLGLFHAKSKIAEWHGSIEIHSQLGEGTAVHLNLPLDHDPQDSVPTIIVKPSSVIYLVDDDPLTHDLWTARVMNLRRVFPDINFVPYFSPREFLDATNQGRALLEHDVLIMDHDFRGSSETGLDILLKTQWKTKIYLVTGKAENRDIKSRCRENAIDLISKDYSQTIRFSSVEECRYLGVVLVDDDSWIRMNWETAAKEKQVPFVALSTPEEFFQILECIHFNSMFFIDYELHAPILGSDIANRIIKYGYRSVYLTSGHSKEWLVKATGMHNVTGKDFPYDLTLKKAL